VGNSCEQSWSRKPADQTLGHQMPSASLMKALHSMEGALEQLITDDREEERKMQLELRIVAKTVRVRRAHLDGRDEGRTKCHNEHDHCWQYHDAKEVFGCDQFTQFTFGSCF